MSEPYVGEIRIFAGNFAPRGWAFCDGQLLAVSQNDALFSLFGTIYGGDGRTTFALPDMRGRIPVHAGSGPGLTPRTIGNRGGVESVTLTEQQMPTHTHPMASTNTATLGSPGGNVLGETGSTNIYNDAVTDTSMDPDATHDAGSSQAHNNVMPFQCVHYIVALVGIYPSRT